MLSLFHSAIWSLLVLVFGQVTALLPPVATLPDTQEVQSVQHPEHGWLLASGQLTADDTVYDFVLDHRLSSVVVYPHNRPDQLTVLAQVGPEYHAAVELIDLGTDRPVVHLNYTADWSDMADSYWVYDEDHDQLVRLGEFHSPFHIKLIEQKLVLQVGERMPVFIYGLHRDGGHRRLGFERIEGYPENPDEVAIMMLYTQQAGVDYSPLVAKGYASANWDTKHNDSTSVVFVQLYDTTANIIISAQELDRFAPNPHIPPRHYRVSLAKEDGRWLVTAVDLLKN